MSALDDRLVGFARALRDHGVVAGPSDVVDAARIAEVLGWEDRERLREGFASALLRRAGERELFDDLFDVWFPAALGSRSGIVDLAPPESEHERRQRAVELRAELSAALAGGDGRALDQVAARAVAALGRLPNDGVIGSWSAAQTLDALSPQVAIAGAESLLGNSGGGGLTPRFTRDELRGEVAAFERRIAVETRRRNAESRGAQRISRYAVRPPSDRVAFVLGSRQDVEELRRTVGPLARKLATRLAARRRRGRRGPLDLRRTLRRSLATGGVPIRPAHRPPRPHRPDLVLLCDLSSSVAGFSRFTILLVQALAQQFRRVRIFGFVNVVDELTALVLDAPPGSDLTQDIAQHAHLTRWHKNSDYGAALQDFVGHHLDVIGPRTTVLILGDARTNATDPGYEALREIAERARSVHWLNPEPVRQWGSGDSVAPHYAQIVDMHECRDVAQLRAFVGQALPI
ncbi:MAG: VWA domain-containing protein [Phycicoccus sp.]|nr:VWA domain-containing protein [Phycicoccus sp.]